MAKITIEITEQELKDLKIVRNYFGKHDVTTLEHFSYSFLDNLHKKLCDSKVSSENSALPISDANNLFCDCKIKGSSFQLETGEICCCKCEKERAK